MLAVQVRSSAGMTIRTQLRVGKKKKNLKQHVRFESDEELRTVGMRPRVGHGKESRPIMFDIKFLIRELVTIDRLAYHSSEGHVSWYAAWIHQRSKITRTLEHEI